MIRLFITNEQTVSKQDVSPRGGGCGSEVSWIMGPGIGFGSWGDGRCWYRREYPRSKPFIDPAGGGWEVDFGESEGC